MSNVTGLRTVRIAERPNLVWLEVETEDGLVGLGGSFRGARAVEAVLHEQVAPWLLGRDARRIGAVSRHLLAPYLGCDSASAEEQALFEALRDRRIAGAALDVWYRYPKPVEESCAPSRFPFHALPSVRGTPHISGWTEGLMERRRLEAGRPLENVVRPPA